MFHSTKKVSKIKGIGLTRITKRKWRWLDYCFHILLYFSGLNQFDKRIFMLENWN